MNDRVDRKLTAGWTLLGEDWACTDTRTLSWMIDRVDRKLTAGWTLLGED